MYLVLFSLILAISCITGCIESRTDTAGTSEQSASISRLEVDFIPEVADDLFRTEGDVVIWGNASLPYLIMDAVLYNSGQRIDDVRYMMMDIEPCEVRHFEISKNRKVPPGTYNLTLEILGPEGPIRSETRRCKEISTGTDEEQGQVKYIFVSQGEKEPSVISDEDLKAYLARQIRENKSNATAPLENLSRGEDSMAAAIGSLVGSTSSNKYHRPDCRFAVKIKPENRVYFANAKEAQRQGYQPCRTCNP